MPIDSAAAWNGIGRRIATLILLATFALTVSVAAQRNPAQNQLSSPAEDAERIGRLTANGVRIDLLAESDPHRKLEAMSKVKATDLRRRWTVAIGAAKP